MLNTDLCKLYKADPGMVDIINTIESLDEELGDEFLSGEEIAEIEKAKKLYEDKLRERHISEFKKMYK